MTDKWLRLTAAAKRLTECGDAISRSSLSRYMAKYGEAIPHRREGRALHVEIGTLMQHRRENIFIEAKPGRAKKAKSAERAEVPSEPINAPLTGAVRKLNAEAELRELDLAARRRELAPVDEVQAAGREAVALIHAAFEQALEAHAAALVAKYGWNERQVRLTLKDFALVGLETFQNELLARLDAVCRGQDMVNGT